MIPVGTSVNPGELRSGPKWEKTFISCLGVPDTSPGTHRVYRGNIYLDISYMRCTQDDFSNVILHGHKMRFEKYIRGNLADIHHLALGH